MSAPSNAIALVRAAMAQHSSWLHRRSAAVNAEVQAKLDQSSRPMFGQLLMQLEDLTPYERMCLLRGQYVTPQLREVRDTIKGWATDFAGGAREILQKAGIELAAHETSLAYKLLNAVAMDVQDPHLHGEDLYKLAMQQPIMGKLYEDMFNDVFTAAARNVFDGLRAALAAGETNQAVIKRLRGSADMKYADGELASTRNAIATLVRTTRTHIANESLRHTYAALGAARVQVCAVLDGRTSMYCASHDGVVYSLASNFPAPPYHPNCRTTLVPYLGERFKLRPFVAADKPVSQIPKDQRRALVGQTEAKSYSAWFAQQDAAFQREWLGPARYKLYRDGKYSLDRFVDPTGKQYNLEQLRIRDASTFDAVFNGE